MAKNSPTVDKPLPPKLRAALLKHLGVDDFPDQWLRAIADMRRTGLRRVLPDAVSPYHCSSEWHFARFTGDGASLAPLVYSFMFRLAKKSNNAFPSIQALAKYFQVNDDYLYSAVGVLVLSGWLVTIEHEKGKAVKYRPVGHEEWANMHPGHCTRKDEMPWSNGDELGRALHGILGGENYQPNVLKGLRNTGTNDDQIMIAAKQFMERDKGNGGGKDRRKRFQEYLREYASASQS